MGKLFDLVKNSDKPIEAYGKYSTFASRLEGVHKTVTLELTPLCNFACKMCYVRIAPEEFKRNGHTLLRFDDWKKYIDAHVDNGGSNMSFTGGECTLHPDFCKIYSYAYSRGLQLNVFTNGSAITDEILETFKKMPPFAVLITVYGASEQTYERLCGNGDAFLRVRENIGKLCKAGIGVVVQFTATKDNIDDFEAVYLYTKEIDVPIRYTSHLINFNRSTEKTVKDNETYSEKFAKVNKLILIDGGKDEDHLNSLPSINKIISVPRPQNQKGVLCGAAKDSCTINWRGMMQPCSCMTVYQKNPFIDGYEQTWRDMVEWTKNIPLIDECQICPHRHRCRDCVAEHYNDTGEFNKPSPRLCFRILHPEEAARIEADYAKNKDAYTLR